MKGIDCGVGCGRANVPQKGGGIKKAGGDDHRPKTRGTYGLRKDRFSPIFNISARNSIALNKKGRAIFDPAFLHRFIL